MKTALTTLLVGLLAWLAAILTAPKPPLPAPPAATTKASPAPAAQPVPLATSTTHINERFRSALDPRNPFTTAERLVAIVDGMTAEDFTALLAKPRDFPSLSSYGMDHQLSESLVEILIARWLEVNPDGAYEQIKTLEKSLIIDGGSVYAGSGSYIRAFARLRPRTLLDDAAFVAEPGRHDEALRAAFETLGRDSIATAREYIARLGAVGKTHVGAVGSGLARRDPGAATAMALRENNREIFHAALAEAARRGAAELRAVLQLNDRKFDIGFSLPQLVASFPDEDWTRFVKDQPDERRGYSATDTMIRLRSKISPAESRAILENIERIPEAARGEIIGSFFYGWSDAEPQAALDWAVNHPAVWKTDFPPATFALSQWFERDSAAAQTWVNSQPPSPLRDQMANALALGLAGSGRLEEARTAFRAAAAEPEHLADFARSLGERDIAAAGDWVASLPPGVDAAKAAEAVAFQWEEKSPQDAAAWIAKLPEGPRRDAAVQAFATQVVSNDAAAAAEWVGTIAEPSARGRAAGIVFSAWSRRDPAAARRWLREIPGVDESLRDRILRRGWQ